MCNSNFILCLTLCSPSCVYEFQYSCPNWFYTKFIFLRFQSIVTRWQEPGENNVKLCKTACWSELKTPPCAMHNTVNCNYMYVCMYVCIYIYIYIYIHTHVVVFYIRNWQLKVFESIWNVTAIIFYLLYSINYDRLIKMAREFQLTQDEHR